MQLTNFADMLSDYRVSLSGFHSRVDNELTILLYHGVTKIRSMGIENIQGKHIEASDFANQMKYLRKYCYVLSLDEFLEIQRSRDTLPPKSTVISFDDGFQNNYSVAAPILEEYQIPAIFYISSGIVNTDMMFWVDILEDAINLSGKGAIRVRLDQDEEFSIRNNSEKLQALARIKGYCKTVTAVERDRIIQETQDATGVVAAVSHSENYQKISWRELREMHENSLFTIGGHSTYHNILSFLEGEELKKEVRASIELLELNLKAPIIHYSYPEGQAIHYNEEIIELLKNSGIVCAPSAICGLNDLATDPFHLKRVMVGFCNTPFPFWDPSI
jgi:peptidoglycan/xylan/chitin deacetylase (PgdA/CDA1 family)